MARDTASDEEEMMRKTRLSSRGVSPDAEQAEEQPLLEPTAPSEIACSLERLRSATIEAVAKRERLPRTLFWSLFRTEIESIKKKKAKRRLLRCLSEIS